ncbi:unnamed protein product [Arctia plantaginis]|uniref:Uncharacterized protein n=1 Tax=Arctia plantaginis TaxID=874455 RepID=A0A8S1B901_ARCPL|nr:unnamed protein product [Arctia plantaginis]
MLNIPEDLGAPDGYSFRPHPTGSSSSGGHGEPVYPPAAFNSSDRISNHDTHPYYAPESARTRPENHEAALCYRMYVLGSCPGCAGDPAVDLRNTNKRRGSEPPSAHASQRPRPSPRTVGGALGTRPRLKSRTATTAQVAPLLHTSI